MQVMQKRRGNVGAYLRKMYKLGDIEEEWQEIVNKVLGAEKKRKTWLKKMEEMREGSKEEGANENMNEEEKKREKNTVETEA